jgi:hypothetical protein
MLPRRWTDEHHTAEQAEHIHAIWHRMALTRLDVRRRRITVVEQPRVRRSAPHRWEPQLVVDEREVNEPIVLGCPSAGEKTLKRSRCLWSSTFDKSPLLIALHRPSSFLAAKQPRPPGWYVRQMSGRDE